MTAIPHLTEPADPAPWAQDVINLLGRDPRPLSDLVAALREVDPTVGPEDVEVELANRLVAYVGSDGWVNLRMAADGVVLTHVVTEAEIERGVLHGSEDLALWCRLADEGLPLAGGRGTVQARSSLPIASLTADSSWWDVNHELAGPAGWLAGVAPMTVLGLRLRDGHLELEAVPLEVLAQPDPEQVGLLVTVAAREAAEALGGYLADRSEPPRADGNGDGRGAVPPPQSAASAHASARAAAGHVGS